MSQIVVFTNSLSGTLAYARQGRIEYRWGLALAVAGIVGMALGAFVTENLSRERFQVIFSIILVLFGLYLVLRPVRKGAVTALHQARFNRIPLRWRQLPPALGLGLGAGTFGGVMGLGGGIIITPGLVQLFMFPPHMATATSVFNIALTIPAAIAVHAFAAPLHHHLSTIVLLGLGGLVGAQAGARLSKRISGDWLVRALGIGLLLMSLRLLMG